MMKFTDEKQTTSAGMKGARILTAKKVTEKKSLDESISPDRKNLFSKTVRQGEAESGVARFVAFALHE
jgi:hypothetical protein